MNENKTVRDISIVSCTIGCVEKSEDLVLNIILSPCGPPLIQKIGELMLHRLLDSSLHQCRLSKKVRKKGVLMSTLLKP